MLLLAYIFCVLNSFLHLKVTPLKPDIFCRSLLHCLQSSGVFCLAQLLCIDKVMLLVFIPNTTSSFICPSCTSGPHWWPRAQVHPWWNYLGSPPPPAQGCIRIALSQFNLCCISPPCIFSFCPRSSHSVILTFIAKHKSVTPNLDIYSHAEINSSKPWHLLLSTNQQLQFLEATKN